MKAGMELNFANISEFHYTKMVIEESMRLYPRPGAWAGAILRRMRIGGYRILKNTNV